jgi:hypothetical protein
MGAVCVVNPPGLQALVHCVGLVHALARDGRVLLVVESIHRLLLPRLFGSNKNITFWFDERCPLSRALNMGMDVVELPSMPRAMYLAARVPIQEMTVPWGGLRDAVRETKVLDTVVRNFGTSFLLVWPSAGFNDDLLPRGIPAVDVSRMEVEHPLDLCAIIDNALEVHSIDNWFLALSDMIGSSCKKYCHAYVKPGSGSVCREKYRHRVSVIISKKNEAPI